MPISFQPTVKTTVVRWRVAKRAAQYWMLYQGRQRPRASNVSMVPMRRSHVVLERSANPSIQSGIHAIQLSGWMNLSMPKYPRTKTRPIASVNLAFWVGDIGGWYHGGYASISGFRHGREAGSEEGGEGGGREATSKCTALFWFLYSPAVCCWERGRVRAAV